MLSPLPVTPSLVIPSAALSFTAVRASGPGGQNVNKVASKVELRFDPAACPDLPPDARARLLALAAARLDAEGNLVVRSQRTRDQQRNLEDALEKLAALVRASLAPPPVRKRTRKPRAADRRRLEDKRAASAKKAARRVRAD